MNCVYRLVWNHSVSAWVAVAETARGCAKGGSSKLMATALLVAASAAQAAPAGSQVTAGVAQVAQEGLTTTIRQASPNLSLNWQSFNVGAQEAVNFVQPSASAIAINRILDSNGSQIMGRVNANGQIYLINPNGILFGSGAQINVGGLVASTLDIHDASLNSSARTFSGSGTGRIVNLGSIHAASGGAVALLGNQVSNQGTIVAQLGTVVLGGGSAVTLNFNGNSLVNMVVEQSVLNSLAENGGLIQAAGGKVVLSAGAKDTLLASVVNNSGEIEAHTLVNHEGQITLLAGMAGGTVNVSGSLDASAPQGGHGGQIETSAAQVKVADTARISTAAPNGQTGTWLIDPVDFTIGAGSGALTSSGIGASTLASNLATTSVRIETDASTAGNGDIAVNNAVSWSANQLTLSAHRNININANLNGSGTASLALEYGMGSSDGIVGGAAASANINAAVNLAAGPHFSTQLGSAGPLKNYTVITSLGAQDSTTATDLQGMQWDLTRNYALGSHIDASATASWNAGAGFKPVGFASAGATAFTGTFDGLGHTISNLSIQRPTSVDVGLFGAAADNAEIRNVGLLGGSVVGGAGTGSLLGTAVLASINHSYNTGSVSGAAGTGGLAGVITAGGISNSYNTGPVSGAAGTGGLIGVLTTGSISDSYNTAAVTGNAGTGGLAGVMTTGSISSSYSTGNVMGNAGTGGLAGGLTTGDVSGSYATGDITGDAGTGGLAGTIATGSISNSYTTGNVVGAAGTGGLAGGISTGTISGSFTTGTVTGGAGTSSLAGTSPAGSITNSFAVSAGQTIDFAALSASGQWALSASGLPVLKSLVKTFTITANDFTKTYDGLNFTGGNGVSYSDLYPNYLTGSLTYSGSAQTARNANTYAITPTGLSSTNSQYLVAYVSGKLTITPAPLSLSAVSGSKVYDGSTSSSGSVAVSGLVTGDTVSGSSQAFASKNVLGTSGSTLNVAGYTVNDGNSGANYSVTTNSASGSITQAALALSAVTGSKVYDGGTTSSGAVAVSGLASGDSVSNSSQAFTSKNVLGSNASTLQVNSDYTVNDGNSGGNYAVTTNTAQGSITQAALALSAVTGTKVYDGSTSSSGSVAVSGLATGDSVSDSSQAFASKNVLGTSGSTLNVAGYTINDGNSGGNYSVTTNSASGSITQAALALRAVTGTKVYDGSTSSSGGVAVSGLASGDSVSGSSQAFASKNVLGSNASTLQVNSGYTVNDGNSGGNYAVTTNTAQGSITQAALSLSAVTGTKVYDGSTSSTGSVAVSGLATGDSVSGSSQAFASKNVLGTSGSTLNVAGYTINDGNSGGNYSVTTNSVSGSITQAALILSAVTGSKVYDGSISSSGAVAVSGLATGDSVSDSSQAFASKNVLGTSGSTLNVAGYTVNDGNSGLNYAVTTNSASGSITQAALSLSASTGTKVYDGGTISSGAVAVSGLATGDSVTSTSQAFASKNVLGTNASTLQVNSGYTVNDGNSGGNYSVTTNTAQGSITQAALSLSAVTGSKVYDGSTSASGSVAVSGLATGDSVSGSSQAFANKNVLGTSGSTLQVNSGYTVNDGNSGLNYAVTTNSASGSITQAALALSAVTGTKVYDGSTSSTGSVAVSGLATGDTVSGSSQAFASKNVLGASGSTLNVAGYTVNDGNSGLNYAVTSNSASGSITQAALSLSAVTGTKVYDGNTTSSGAVAVSGLASGDSVTSTSQAFASKNVLGTSGSTLNVAGYTINDGNSGLNYAVTSNSASGSITQAALSLNAVTGSKVYDGGTTSTDSVAVSGLATGDSVSGSSQAFASKNVIGSNASTLQVNSGYTVNDGNSGGNYAVTTNTAQGSITQAALALSAVTGTKVYDGSTSSSGSVAVTGLASGDSVSGSSQAFASKNVLGANASTLQVNSGYTVNDGNSGLNYAVTTNSASGSITQAALALSAVTGTKVYDGGTTSSGAVAVSGLATGDSVSGSSQAFASKNVLGTNSSTLQVNSGYTVNDGNSGGNYAVTTNTAQGSITQAALALNAVTGSKVYDGSTSSSGSVAVSGLATGDSVMGSSQSFASKNVLGANASTLQVNSGYTVNDGNSGGNYSVTTNSASGSITQAALALSAVTGSKVYDGSTSSSGSVAVSGLATGDSVTSTSQTFASKNVLGTSGSTLQVNSGYIVNDGNSGGNYSVTTNSASGSIAQAALALSAVTGSKVYDGGTTSSGAVAVSGLASGDSVSNSSQAFASKNVLGTNSSTLQVNSGYTVNDGNSGGNYSVTTNSASGSITQAALALSASTGSKVYDGSTSSSGSVAVSGLATGDSVTSTSQSFASKNVLGVNASTLNVAGYTINDGNSGLNYAVTTNSASGSITQAALALSAVTGSKVYDGSTSSSGSVAVSGLATGDSVTSTSQAFASKNVLGTSGSTLNVAGYTVNDGNSGGNYSVTTNSASGSITQAALALSAVTGTKVYDGVTNSSGSVAVSDLASGDSVTGSSQAYASKNVLGSNASTLQVNSGYTVNDGNSGGNYAVTTNTAQGSITQAALSLSASTGSKVYDGSTSSSGSVAVSGLASGDSVTSTSQAFASKNVLGISGSTLNVAGYTINDGNSGLNYAVTTNSVSGSITQAALSLSASTGSKVYDGSTSSSGSVAVSGLATGDSVTSTSQAFASKNVLGTSGSTLQVNSGYIVNDGNSGGNYAVTTNTAQGSITQAALSLSAVTSSKVYDGSTSSAGVVGVSSLATGDTVTGTSQAFASKNALGTSGSTLQVNSGYTVNDGNSGLNYAVTTNTAQGSITQAALALSAVTSSKVYDGSTSSSGSVAVTGLASGDSVSDSSQAFASKNVLGSNASTLNVASYTVNDGNSGLNYAVTTNSASGTITRLTSVTWIGSASGNWFDAANWQGGAVPDLANVANVFIPAGISVNFNNANASSTAQAGLVQVDSIGSLGALTMAQGSLNVANNLALTSLTQTGGTMGGNGNYTVKNFSQTGGTVANAGNFSVENSFTQSETGVIAVGGNIGLTQTTDSLVTTHLSGNHINLTANNGGVILGTVNARGVLTVNATGNITQSTSSTVKTDSASNLASSSGDIVLPNVGNDQDGIITASAKNITLTDATNPIFVLNATGNSALIAGSNLTVSGVTNNLTTTSQNSTTSFGATTIHGDLTTRSSGSVSQTSPVTVLGSVSIDTKGNDLTTILRDKVVLESATVSANLIAAIKTIGLTEIVNAITSFSKPTSSANLTLRRNKDATAVKTNIILNEESSQATEN